VAIANELDTSRNRPDRQESPLHAFLTPEGKGQRTTSMPRRFSFESKPMREMPRMRAAALRFPLV